MAKYCAILEHTADVGLGAHADTLEELFEALGEGLCDLICSRQQARPTGTRRIEMHAEDVEALAVDFLSKILWAIQTEHFVVAAVAVISCDDNAVVADLVGEPYCPDRHELITEIKAVTYHQLKVAREGDKWVARVFVDL